MNHTKPDMLKGTLDLLILRILATEPMHGWGISERIHRISDDALAVNQGSLYVALLRLTRQGWIKSGWQNTENNRRARYYELTRAGRSQLEVETDRWRRLSTGVQRILATA
jgi:transcriptional regulator